MDALRLAVHGTGVDLISVQIFDVFFMEYRDDHGRQCSHGVVILFWDIRIISTLLQQAFSADALYLGFFLLDLFGSSVVNRFYPGVDRTLAHSGDCQILGGVFSSDRNLSRYLSLPG